MEDDGVNIICQKWTKLYRRVYHVSTGFSGYRNDAPFCQFFEREHP